MIRRSSAIAAAAILLSLLLHLLGLGFTSVVEPVPSSGETATDEVTLGNAFEEVVDTVSEPVEAEPAEPPEPPVETPPEPDTAVAPTSQALVASPDPQNVLSPDTGSAAEATADSVAPSEPGQGQAVAPETVPPSGADVAQAAPPPLAAPVEPVEPDTAAQSPQGTPDAAPVSPEPDESAPVSPAPEQLAALPAPAAPVPPVASSPSPSVQPVEPPDQDAIEPVPTETAPPVEEADTSDSDLAVAVSPRPRLRSRPSPNSPPEPTGQRDGADRYSDLRRPPVTESPLTAYLRGQGDLEIQKSQGSQFGGMGFESSRGPGNSNVTNYAGQVLVHLNRAPAVPVSGQGFARVFFEIKPDGSLAWVDVIESSGSPQIDSAARAQVRAAAPFPRPPKGADRRLVFVFRSN